MVKEMSKKAAATNGRGVQGSEFRGSGRAVIKGKRGRVFFGGY